MQKTVTDDMEAMLDILPPRIRQPLSEQKDIKNLLEVILDLGRPVEARFHGREMELDSKDVEEYTKQGKARFEYGRYGGPTGVSDAEGVVEEKKKDLEQAEAALKPLEAEGGDSLNADRVLDARIHRDDCKKYIEDAKKDRDLIKGNLEKIRGPKKKKPQGEKPEGDKPPGK